MISSLKITKGHKQQKMHEEQLLLISARRLAMLYICGKFREIIWKGIKVIERTRFLY